MTDTPESYNQLVKKLATWARAIPDIRAVIIVGSRARIDHPADEWADLDVLLITTDPQRYIASSEWLGTFGRPLLTFLEPTAVEAEMERRVLFDNMLDVDFSIIPMVKFRMRVQQLLNGEMALEMADQIVGVFRRGFRVLLDNDGIADQLNTVLSTFESPLLPSSLPTEEEFFNVINDFLYHAVYTAKHLFRGELWWSITSLNCYMQRLMCRMIEWHAKTLYGEDHETWFRGRFLEEWAHPNASRGLMNTFASYSKDGIRDALFAIVDTFHSLAMEIASHLKYPYSPEIKNTITSWMYSMFAKG